MQSKPGLITSTWDLIEVRAFSSIMYRHGTDKTFQNTEKSLMLQSQRFGFRSRMILMNSYCFQFNQISWVDETIFGLGRSRTFHNMSINVWNKYSIPDHWCCLALIDDSKGNLIFVPKQSIAYNSHKSIEVHSISFAAPSPKALLEGSLSTSSNLWLI